PVFGPGIVSTRSTCARTPLTRRTPSSRGERHSTAAACSAAAVVAAAGTAILPRVGVYLPPGQAKRVTALNAVRPCHTRHVSPLSAGHTRGRLQPPPGPYRLSSRLSDAADKEVPKLVPVQLR